MTRRLPPLTAVRAFEAAARLNSIKDAAAELFVTPSAVSHQIKSLEGFLGVALFRRTRRQLDLTAAGERYLEVITHALDEIDLATRRVRSAPNSGVVNVSVSPSFLTRWLVPRIRQFQNRFPDIELRLSPNSGPIDFAWSDIDMAIYFGNGAWADVECTFLQRAVLVPVCSPQYAADQALLDAPARLATCTLIDVAARPNAWDRVLEMAGAARPKQGKRVSFSSTSLAINAAMEDLGVALADRQLIAREVRFGQLVRPVALELPLNDAFYLVYQKGRRLTTGMQSFFDWVLQTLAGEQEQGNDDGGK